MPTITVTKENEQQQQEATQEVRTEADSQRKGREQGTDKIEEPVLAMLAQDQPVQDIL